MAGSRRVLTEIGEILRKGLDFRSSWERPESEKLQDMRDVSAILLVVPAFLIMQRFTAAESASQRYVYASMAYALCLIAIVVHSRECRTILWAIYLPQWAASLLILSLFPGPLGEGGSDVPLVGALALTLIGATLAIVRRKELRLVHLGLTFFPLALVPL